MVEARVAKKLVEVEFEVEAFTAKKLVEVALVVVPLVARKSVRVEEALERKPPINSMTVVVACSLPVCLVNGKAKVKAAGKVVRQSPEIQRMVVEAY